MCDDCRPSSRETLSRSSPSLTTRACTSTPSLVSYEPTGTEVLQGRYRVSYDHLLGEGSNGRVYKALDIEANKQVAVKIYKDSFDDEGMKLAIANVSKCVDVISAITSASRSLLDTDVERGDAEKPKCTRGNPGRASFSAKMIEADAEKAIPGSTNVVQRMDLTKCFVSLLGYSKDSNGEPGMDIDSEKVFVVTEVGEESLQEFLDKTAESGKTLSLETLRCVHWSLVSIACALHAADFVHLDIKPLNVMRFGEVWKLIDFDGAIRTRSWVPVTEMWCSEWYMPPELAGAFLSRQRFGKNKPEKVEVSRLMDVWSVGLSALEAVFLQPVLKPFYTEWFESTGSNVKFLSWLSDYSETLLDGDMREFMNSMDQDMSDFLQGVLRKDPGERCCIAESLVHPWFEPIRIQMWKSMKLREDDSANGSGSRSMEPWSRTLTPNGVASGKKTQSRMDRLRNSAAFFGSRSSSYRAPEERASRACATM